MKQLKARIEALEKRRVIEPTILTMPSGEAVGLSGHGDYLLKLLGAVFDEPTPDQKSQFDVICSCSDIKEQGGGHITELIRSLLLSPTHPDEVQP
ncbi:MAG TPA: hypothetical protein VKB79_06875 [Bryobacteraceae bacterium]|nr:hypothetical protein [Bryobacteraceae bacterium]